ncbi:MAG TPA: ABC transporter permease [Verrucomicrobiae bacterium]|nr:ABC transporter permease [Verrucomicrobiae bacterium]
MTLWTRIRSWLRAILDRERSEHDMDAELRFHLDACTEDLIRAGVPREEAQRRARLEFGGLDRAKEECREARGATFLPNLFRDAHFALRTLRKNPAFTAVAVLTLALGIGANTAIFSVVNAILLRPLPYPEPSRLVRLWETSPTRGWFRNVVNPFNFLDWRDNAKAFQSMAALTASMTNLNLQGRPVAVHGMQVTTDFFSVLEIPPYLGRTFNPQDGVPGQDHVVILGYDLWRDQFGGDSSIIGRNIDVEGVPYAVVGVAPRGFSFPKTQSQVWTPLPIVRTKDWSDGRYLTVVARLKPGVSLAQAQQDMQSLGSLTANVRPDMNHGWSAEAVPMLTDVTKDVRRSLWILLSAVGFLLLIACANVANLILMRASGRLREMAVRSALGAERARLIQQLLVESVLLSLAGMAAGLSVAYFGLQGLLALIPANAPLPRSEPIHIDAQVLLFTFFVSLCSAVIFGLVPALRLSRVELQDALKQGSLRSGVGGHQMLRRVFVVAEVALALLLSVGAGLMLRSFSRLVAVDPGFNPDHLLTMHLSVFPTRYSDDLKRASYFERLLAEIRHVSGVHAAGTTHFLPLTEMTSGSCFAPAPGPQPTPADSPSSDFLIVSPGYFLAMGIPLAKGRDFEDRDNFNAPPVAVVNRAFVDHYFSGQDAVGKQLYVCWTIEKPVEIVGVVADARQSELQQAPQPTIFLSNSQAPMYFATLVVRAEGDPRALSQSIEDAIHRVDPDQPVSDVQTMSSVFSASVASPRFQATLLGVFAAIAMALAIVGIYGVVSYSVSQRTNEIGIRIAMGAASKHIVGMVLGEALLLTALAIAIGLCVAVALSRVLQSLLFEVTPTDPLTLGVVACVILAIAAVAAVLPARRAMRVDPVVALRYE